MRDGCKEIILIFTDNYFTTLKCVCVPVMNDYQILQDIGKSKSALVYKGRKKKTVEFYALKCVDKSQKQKVSFPDSHRIRLTRRFVAACKQNSSCTIS